ncbi:MAG: nucleotidyltransferase domain-containing protein [Planctomycetes bacterium]|nr:nucleotidyltransferase domain-containing protein [Planctomycetota bacterium]
MVELTSHDRVVGDLVAALREGLGEDLRSVVLFGSAAEGRLRPTSDVNVIVVVRAIDAPRAARVADAFRIARVAARVEAMILLKSEVRDAVREFAAKFADVLRRRRVVFGSDPFDGIQIPRDVEVRRLRQSLLNLVLRLRERAVVAPDDRTAALLADNAGPLRAAAAALVVLEGGPPLPPKDALARIAPSLGVPGVADALERTSDAREGRDTAPGARRDALWTLVAIAHAMRERAVALRETRT